MTKRTIRKIAVLGSGVMGARIACHFAGIGLQVLLLDIVAPDARTSDSKTARNKLVNNALQSAIKSNPTPLYYPDAAKHIATGNFEDDLKDIASCDWIIEAITERLDIKQQLYEQVEQYRKTGTLITSNTSGIPIHLLSKGRSEDFKKHFCGTHFFNPPRYLRLLEIIPTPDTDPEIVSFIAHYGSLFLGKTTVPAKDTPAFIANRIGLYSIMSVFKLMEILDLTIDDIDALTGTVIGHPKSATFRTADIVGIDTLVKVANGIYENCPDDEAKDVFKIPVWLNKMVEHNRLGDKTGQGFFMKVKKAASAEKGLEEGSEKEIHTLNLKTFDYQLQQKPKLASVEAAKAMDNLQQRLQMLMASKDKAGEFYRHFHYGLFSYISHRAPEISDEICRIDDAMIAGFGWESGPFESWDTLDVAATVAQMKEAGYTVGNWIEDMLTGGYTSFYKIDKGQKLFYDWQSKTYKAITGSHEFVILNNYKDKLVWNNNCCQLYDIEDDVLGLQWNTKMNTIGSDVLAGINKAIDIAEKNYKGLVIANEGANFSAGANVGMIFMLAIEQEWEELDMAIRLFQNTTMRCRHSSVPVVVAPHGMALGGACELGLHSDKVCAAAETYTGLVELGVGLIPGGGGVKEFVVRASDEMHHDEPETITLKNRFFTIATAKVASSAFEAYNLGIYRKGIDEVIINQMRRIAAAKNSVIEMFDRGYIPPVVRKDIKVLGRSALGALYAGIHGINRAHYATNHDVVVAKKLAYVMCGGDLSEPTLVSEQYLLDLEREAFLSLCGERKTLERIQSVLKGGRPVRN